MKLLLLSFLTLFFSVSSYAQSDSTLLKRIDNIEVLLAKAQTTNDSILKQNETLKAELADHRTKELWFSDLLSINTSWFMAILGIGGVLLGFFSWNKMKSLKEELGKELDIEITKIKRYVNELGQDLNQTTIDILSMSTDFYREKIPRDHKEFYEKFSRYNESEKQIYTNKLYWGYILWSLKEINLNVFYFKLNGETPENQIDNCMKIIKLLNSLYDDKVKYLAKQHDNLITAYEEALPNSRILGNPELTKHISSVLPRLYTLGEKKQQDVFPY